MQVWQTPARQLQRVGTSQASARLSTPPCPVAKAAVMPLRAKVTSGPVPAGPDGWWGARRACAVSPGGIAIFATESVARARELASHDPLVLAGRLELQVMTWWCPPGTMVTNGLPVHIDG